MELTDADNGQHLRVSRGETLTVTLAENPTTGYRWQVVDPDESGVTLEHATYERAEGAAVGGGGRRTFVFTATSSGTTSLKLSCQRPWGRGDSVREFAVTLDVASG